MASEWFEDFVAKAFIATNIFTVLLVPFAVHVFSTLLSLLQEPSIASFFLVFQNLTSPSHIFFCFLFSVVLLPLIPVYGSAVTYVARVYSCRMDRFWGTWLSLRALFFLTSHGLFGALAFYILSMISSAFSSCQGFGMYLGLCWAFHFLATNKNELKLPVVQQPRFFRLKRMMATCTISSAKLAVVFTSLCVAYDMSFSTFGLKTASIMFGEIPALFVATWCVAFSLTLISSLFENFSTTTLKDGMPVSDMIASLDMKDKPLLQHLAFYELDMQARTNTSFRKMQYATGNDEAPWNKICGLCVSFLNQIRKGLDPDGTMETFTLPEDYTSHPFDNPSLIGSGYLTKNFKKPSADVPLPPVSPPHTLTLGTDWRSHASLKSTRLGHGSGLVTSLTRQAPVQAKRVLMSLRIDKAWFLPSITYADALNLLKSRPAGCFVVHGPPPAALHGSVHPEVGECLALTVLQSSAPWSSCILFDNHSFRLLHAPVDDQGLSFASIPALIQYYSSHPYYIDATGMNHKLIDYNKPLQVQASFQSYYTLTLKPRVKVFLKRFALFRYLFEECGEVKKASVVPSFAMARWAIRSLGAFLSHAREEDSAQKQKAGKGYVQGVCALLDFIDSLDVFMSKYVPSVVSVASSSTPPKGKAQRLSAQKGTYEIPFHALRLEAVHALKEAVRRAPGSQDAFFLAFPPSHKPKLQRYISPYL